jgi:MFS family permease
MKRPHHPLIQALLDLRGNPRACVYAEPLWGIAFNLYAPFATLYMAHLGVTDTQIGLLMTIGMCVQIVSSLLGSILIDKTGRRMSALVLGLLSWTIPPAVLMLAQNFWWFLLAALFNGIGLIESVAWNCLLVEDAESDKLVDMYNWTTISGLLAVFFAPLAGLLVRTLSLVTALRLLYGFALVMMTAKTLILFFWSRETRQGLVRMRETRGVPYAKLLGQYRGVLRHILHSRTMLQILVIIVTLHITNLINSYFFALFATRNAGIPEWLIAWFPMVRSAIMLVFMFGIQSRITHHPIHRTMITGIGLYLAALLFLLLAPHLGSGLLLGYILLDAAAFALVWPRRNSLLVQVVDAQERARILALLYVLMILCATPFGYLSGFLSEQNRALPFLLNIALYLICAFVLIRLRIPAEPAPVLSA